MRLDRVLQGGTVDLDRVVREAGAGQHGGPHDEVVGQRRARRHARRHLAHGGHVALQVGVQLGVTQVGEGPGVEPLVAVGHVDRQHRADRRPVDGDAGGRAPGLHPQRAVLPRPDRVHPGQRERPRLLAEEVDAVAEPGQRLGQLGVVDVRPRAPQEVPVEHQDIHRRASLAVRSVVATPGRAGQTTPDARQGGALRGGRDCRRRFAASARAARRGGGARRRRPRQRGGHGAGGRPAGQPRRRAAHGLRAPRRGHRCGDHPGPPRRRRRGRDRGLGRRRPRRRPHGPGRRRDVVPLPHRPGPHVGDAVSAALRGRGMLDPDVIRPVLRHYGELLDDYRGAIGRRSRAWPPRSRPRTRSPAAICRP